MMLQYLDIFIGFATVMLGASLLITILTQLISGVLGLRGTNLRWGIETLLESASPELKDHAKEIAHAVLHHRLISDSTFSKFGLFQRVRLATAIRSKELSEILTELAKQSEEFPWAEPLKADLNDVKKKAEDWFDRTMDRVSQRFAMSLRYWTVGFSFLAAMGLHLDAIALFKRISEDSTVRAKLVSSAETVLNQTANAIGAEGATNVYRLALEQLQTNEPEAKKALTNPPAIFQPDLVNFWMRTRLSNSPAADKILTEYQRLVSSNTIARAPELMGSLGLVRDELAGAGLQLIPDYSKIRRQDYLPNRRSFWGMVISGALLSLGAPFWFNGLKTLLSLRTTLAKNVQQETEKQKKQDEHEQDRE